jgi:hypothetical protein
MIKERLLRIILISMFLLCSWSIGAPLSYANIKSLYKEGEFEKMKVTLETFLKQSGNSAQTNDKIFAYKYLGVAYAAEPKWSPIAESYFFQLFELAPNVHISDMYVSSAVQTLFEKTKERFQKENREITEYDEFGNPRVHPNPGKGTSDNPPRQDTLISPVARKNPDPIPASRKQPNKDAKIRVWPWVLGGAVIAVAGGLWWYSSLNKSPKKTVYPANQ